MIDRKDAAVTLGELEKLRWREPWALLSPDRRIPLERELEREISPGHPLHGKATTAAAARIDCDDVLFVVEGGGLAIVHLTWSRETSSRWPHTVMVSDIETFVDEHLRPDHQKFVGG